MFKAIFKSLFFTICIISGIYFCIEYQSYHCTPLPYPTSMVEPFQKKGVHITAKVYDAKDSQTYLDRNLKNIGIQPVQVTIQNNTEKSYFLSEESINISNRSSGSIATALTLKTVPRSIGIKVAALFFWPMIFPSTIDSIHTFKSHKKLAADYQAKSLKKEGEWIPPYATVHRIVFTAQNEDISQMTVALQHTGQQISTVYSVRVS